MKGQHWIKLEDGLLVDPVTVEAIYMEQDKRTFSWKVGVGTSSGSAWAAKNLDELEAQKLFNSIAEMLGAL